MVNIRCKIVEYKGIIIGEDDYGKKNNFGINSRRITINL